MNEGKVVYIQGFRNWWGVFITRFLPGSLVRIMTYSKMK